MRLIDVDKLLNDIHRTVEESGLVHHECEIMDCIEYADVIDTDIEAEPVQHGKWIDVRGGYLYECSKCKAQANSNLFKSNLKYCPNCGAKMDLKD